MSSDDPAGQQPPSFDQKKWVHEIQREDAHRAHDQNAQFVERTNEATIKSGDAALRAALLINGGAAVSVLAFIGGMVSQDRIKIAQLADVASSLMLFAFGVSAAVAGLAFSYFTNFVSVGHATSVVLWWQHPYVRPGPHTRRWAHLKNALHIAAVVVGIASLVLFICGMYDVRNSIVKLATSRP